MQGTTISNIDYDNNENAKIIEEALKETEVLDIEYEEPRQEAIMSEQQQPMHQPFQNPQEQYIRSNKVSPFQQEYQQPIQHQYNQPMMQQPMIQQQDLNEEKKDDIFSSPIINNLKHSFVLLILLFFLNNQGFKNIISQLPFTLDDEGDANIWLTVILCLIIVFFYCIYLQICN
tara:strand:+ start:1790 stop:2311 length:522 start_codon:yes stop_codon:yes gene_type:complete